jgi:hypothetical protein
MNHENPAFARRLDDEAVLTIEFSSKSISNPTANTKEHAPKEEEPGPKRRRLDHALQKAVHPCRLPDDRAFGYLFDFGDNWLHQINVTAVEETPGIGRYPKVTEKVGRSPPQYPDEDED